MGEGSDNYTPSGSETSLEGESTNRSTLAKDPSDLQTTVSPSKKGKKKLRNPDLRKK